MEYIENKLPAASDMELLGHDLAALHKIGTSESFGWSSDNFIGNLAQFNTCHLHWASFYAKERLLPQLKLALRQQLISNEEVPMEEKVVDRCTSLLKNAQPAFLHGDLWSGNFLIGTTGIPYIIDPAVYCGHSEVDIAMTQLFGGFSSHFYHAYREHIPVIDNKKEMTHLYQLYYLLVH